MGLCASNCFDRETNEIRDKGLKEMIKFFKDLPKFVNLSENFLLQLKLSHPQHLIASQLQTEQSHHINIQQDFIFIKEKHILYRHFPFEHSHLQINSQHGVLFCRESGTPGARIFYRHISFSWSWFFSEFFSFFLLLCVFNFNDLFTYRNWEWEEKKAKESWYRLCADLMNQCLIFETVIRILFRT